MSDGAKRVGDTKLPMDQHAVLDVLRPKHIAIAFKRGRNNHRSIDRQVVALGDGETCRMKVHRERLPGIRLRPVEREIGREATTKFA